MRRILIALVLAAFAGLAASQTKGVPVGFKQIPLGAQGADVIHQYPWVDCGKGGLFGDLCTLSPSNCYPTADNFSKCTASMTYAGLPLKSAEFHLLELRVALVDVRLEASLWDRLRETLTLALGKPTKTGSTLTRIAGVDLPNEHLTWQRGLGQITASRFGSDASHSAVMITTPGAVAEAERRRKADIEAGARDL